MGEWHERYNFFGFIGGVILASALLPQIYLALRRRSTADISYVWQAVYTLGLLTLLVYYLHFQLWSVLYPMVFEFCCLMFLTSLKVYYEVFLGRVEQPTTDDAQEDLEVMRGAPLSRMPSKLALEALKSDMSRSGRIGRMPSKLSLGGAGYVSRSGMGASVSSSLCDDRARSGSSASRGRMKASVVAASVGDAPTRSSSDNRVFMPALARREESAGHQHAVQTTGDRVEDAAVPAGDHQV